MRSDLKDAVLLLFCVIVWALSFPAIKFLLSYFNPISLSFVRFSMASLSLMPVFVLYRKPLMEQIKKMPLIFLIFSILVVPLPDLSQNFGMDMMDPESAASMASILQPMSPVFVLILATLFLKEKFTINKGIGIFLAFAGVVLLSTDGLSRIRAGNITGEALILLSALSYALSGIFGKMILDRSEGMKGPLSTIVWSYFIGSAFLLPFYMAEGNFPEIDSSALMVLIFLSIFTLIPYFLWYIVLRKNEVSRQSAYVFLIPLFGVLFSSLFLGEKLSPQMLLYGALIMVGVYVSQKSKIFIKYYP